jgi:hypothetical protein
MAATASMTVSQTLTDVALRNGAITLHLATSEHPIYAADRASRCAFDCDVGQVAKIWFLRVVERDGQCGVVRVRCT